MKSNTFRIISIVLCLAMLFSLGACAKEEKAVKIEPMEEIPPVKYTFEFLGDDVMPISGFYGPMLSNYSVDGQTLPNYITDDFMAAIKEAGFNFLHQQYVDYAATPGTVMELLDLGLKHNVGIGVTDSRVTGYLGDKTLSVDQIDELTNDYRNHPAFCGLYVVDEPGTEYYYSTTHRQMKDYPQIFKNLKELNIFGSSNLFPMISRTQEDVYRKYLQEYIDTCDVEFLAWDKYCFDKGNKNADYFTNMSLCREYAEKASIPFWPYIQAGSQWNDGASRFDTNGYYPNEGQLTWNVNTCLAYGAKGMLYFPLIQPSYYAYAQSTPFDFERNGIFGAWGNKNRWYYYAKNANAQIAACDEVLMNATNMGIIVTGKQAKADTRFSNYIMEKASWRELKKVTGDTMIGCFNYNGGSAFYVVNYDTEYSQKITLDFVGTYNMSVTQEAKKSYINTSSLELKLLPGSAALVVIE